jgi:hypothetical protein
LRRYSLILLTLCALFCAGLELSVRYGLPRIRSIDARIDREHALADELRPVPGKPLPILIVGNSLMQKAIDFKLLNEKLYPDFAVTRFVVEDTRYLDWYYGLSRLFREGARPKMVVLVLNAHQLVAPETRGDLFAHVLMDHRDLLSVKRSLGIDNTSTSNLLFANFSRFYGLRSEIHKWFLVCLMPDFPDFAAKLRPPPSARVETEGEVDREAAERLKRMSSLCAKYGALFTFVVPPSAMAQDGSSAIQRAGAASGVPVLVPIQPQQLPVNLFAPDGFHLNYRGSRVFTRALVSTLQQGGIVDNQGSKTETP